MRELVICLDQATTLELETVDIEVADESIAFDIDGVIRGLDEDALSAVGGKSLTPTKIHFAVTDE